MFIRVPDRFAVALLTIVTFIGAGCGGQMPDRDFSATVERPAFVADHPRVLFDEAHNNLHTTTGTYKPFVDLLTRDGYAVVSNKEPFSRKVLEGFSTLVISNARGIEKKFGPAFTEEECSTVEEWVRGGGSLLLIADHYPIGSATEILSKHFGVGMSNGFTNDSLHSDSPTRSRLNGHSQLVFSRENGLLGDHAITRGRDSSEKVDRAIAFTGQSLKGMENAVSFLTLAPSAYDIVPDSIWEERSLIFFSSTYTRFSDPISAAGRSQGLALGFGKGRVVVLGEAAMLTAQIVRQERFGMQVSGNDNRQLALNIMHWLSGVL